MPAWKAARNDGQSSQMGQIKQRSDPKHSFWDCPYNIDDGICYFCRSKEGRKTTGYLKMTGPVLVCQKCKGKRLYKSEKIYQNSL